MVEKKKDLLLTERKKTVLLMILEILSLQRADKEPYRIRKLHNKLIVRGRDMAKPPSNCLVATTIKDLVEAEILTVVEKGITEKDAENGRHMESVLYDWNDKVFGSYEVKVVRSKPPKARKKREKPVAEPPVTEEAQTHEDWHLALKQEIRDKEAQYAALGVDIAQLKELDESAENVRKCFLQRRRK